MRIVEKYKNKYFIAALYAIYISKKYRTVMAHNTNMDKHVSRDQLWVSFSLMFLIPCRVTSQCHQVCITFKATALSYIVHSQREALMYFACLI